jgi:hypothetical protein
MIVLDEQQDRVLRDMAAEIARGEEERLLKNLRRWAVWGLTLSRWWNPRKFEEWNAARTAEHRNRTAWMR